MGYKDCNAFMSCPIADLFVDKEGSVSDAEIRLVRENGDEFWTLISLFPFILGRQQATLVWLYDISDRLEQEKATQESHDASAEIEMLLRDTMRKHFRRICDL